MSRQLWPHQERAIALTAAEFSRGAKSVCIVMPTAAGKSSTCGSLATRHLAKRSGQGRILWLAHRTELIGQAYDELVAWGHSCGVIQASPVREVNPHRPVQVASVQTLLARKHLPDATLLITDESHHFSDNKFSSIAEHYRKQGVPIIGCTATPIRLDGKGFEGLFDALVCPITMKELIAQGFLTPYSLIVPPQTLQTNQIAQCPVRAYQDHAEGRKAIVFAGNVKAAKEFADKFNAAGISCQAIWGDMDGGKRIQYMEAYKAGLIKVLTNCSVAVEGWDDRPTSCVILARSCGSLSFYLQALGRALRISPETGKKDAILIDLHGSSRVHGPPDEDREWTLEGTGLVKKNLEQAKERFCLVCKVLLEPDSGSICELCGIARPEVGAPDVVNVKLVKYEHLQRKTNDEKRAMFEKMVAIAQAAGYSPKQPLAKYKAMFGEWPNRSWLSHKSLT